MAHILIISLPDDTTENVDQLAQELAEGLDLGQYGATVTVPTPDLADYLCQQLEEDGGNNFREPADVWENNSVQFPRLLAEIAATQDQLNLPALAEAMDVTPQQVSELFDRAQAQWEVVKAKYMA